MKDSTARFAEPLNVPCPRGARLLEAFSPKLGRPIRLFDRARFPQWVRLEADPSVLTLCERPARLGNRSDGQLADFWIQRHDREEVLVLENEDATVPAQVNGLTLRVIARAELAAANVWVTNWQRMLPVINATRNLVPRGLTGSVQSFVFEPVALSRVEQRFAIGDPSLVRGAIFKLLRTGPLRAPVLHTQPLSLQTVLEPTQ